MSSSVMTILRHTQQEQRMLTKDTHGIVVQEEEEEEEDSRIDVVEDNDDDRMRMTDARLSMCRDNDERSEEGEEDRLSAASASASPALSVGSSTEYGTPRHRAQQPHHQPPQHQHQPQPQPQPAAASATKLSFGISRILGDEADEEVEEEDGESCEEEEDEDIESRHQRSSPPLRTSISSSAAAAAAAAASMAFLHSSLSLHGLSALPGAPPGFPLFSPFSPPVSAAGGGVIKVPAHRPALPLPPHPLSGAGAPPPPPGAYNPAAAAGLFPWMADRKDRLTGKKFLPNPLFFIQYNTLNKKNTIVIT